MARKISPFNYKRLSLAEQEKRGILGRLVGPVADTKNSTRNERNYGAELWENVFNSEVFIEQLENKAILGELGHPVDRVETKPMEAAIALAEKPILKEDGLYYGIFDILNTPAGKVLKALCDYGTKVGISSRGQGDLIDDWSGNQVVDPDTYDFECWDVVLLPAVKEARLEMVTESLKKKRYNKTLKQRLVEDINELPKDEQEIANRGLKNLGFTDDEDKELLLSDYEDQHSDDYLEDDEFVADPLEDEIEDLQEEDDFGDEHIRYENLYGETEIIYKGYLINQGEDGVITVEIDGDEMYFDTFEEAKDAINNIVGNEPYDYTLELERIRKTVNPDAQLISGDFGENLDYENDISLTENYKNIDDLLEDIEQKIYYLTSVEPSEDGLWHFKSEKKYEKAQEYLDSLGINYDDGYDGSKQYFNREVMYIYIDEEDLDEYLDNNILTESLEAPVLEPVGKITQEEIENNRIDKQVGTFSDGIKIGTTLITTSGHKLRVNNIVVRFKDNKPTIVFEYDYITRDGRKGKGSGYDEQFKKLLHESVVKNTDSKLEVDDIKSNSKLVAKLSESVKNENALKKENLSLQEQLTVGNAKVVELEESLKQYKAATVNLSVKARERNKLALESKKLQESLVEKEKSLDRMQRRISSLNESISEKRKEDKDLKEKYDAQISTINELEQQLNKSKNLVENYRKSYRQLKNKYVSSLARAYDLDVKELQRNLGESYKISDIDYVINETLKRQRQFGKMPILMEGVNPVIRTNSPLVNNPDDDPSDFVW